MQRLREEPFYGLAPSGRPVPATPLHENRRAFPNESVAPRRARVAIACPTSSVPPARRARPPVTGPPDNQKACLGSLFRTWKASRYGPSYAMTNSKIAADICSLGCRQYNRSGGRKRSQSGADSRSGLAEGVGRPWFMRGSGDHFSPTNFAGYRTPDRPAVRLARKSKSGFSARRQSLQSSDGTKFSRLTDRSVLHRVDRYR